MDEILTKPHEMECVNAASHNSSLQKLINSKCEVSIFSDVIVA
jgi:hypothetical protein